MISGTLAFIGVFYTIRYYKESDEQKEKAAIQPFLNVTMASGGKATRSFSLGKSKERKAQSAGTMVSTARAGRQVAVWSSLDSQPKLSQMWSGQGESTKRAAPSLISMCTV